MKPAPVPLLNRTTAAKDMLPVVGLTRTQPPEIIIVLGLVRRHDMT